MASRPVIQTGAPATASQPATNATAPAAITGGTSGTATRLAAGAIRASRPNVSRTIGSVEAWAASERPRRVPNGHSEAAGTRSPILCASGVPHATSPAVAAAESWKPTSPTMPGSSSSMIEIAQARLTMTLDPRPLSTASKRHSGHERRPDHRR